MTTEQTLQMVAENLQAINSALQVMAEGDHAIDIMREIVIPLVSGSIGALFGGWITFYVTKINNRVEIELKEKHKLIRSYNEYNDFVMFFTIDIEALIYYMGEHIEQRDFEKLMDLKQKFEQVVQKIEKANVLLKEIKKQLDECMYIHSDIKYSIEASLLNSEQAYQDIIMYLSRCFAGEAHLNYMAEFGIFPTQGARNTYDLLMEEETKELRIQMRKVIRAFDELKDGKKLNWRKFIKRSFEKVKKHIKHVE